MSIKLVAIAFATSFLAPSFASSADITGVGPAELTPMFVSWSSAFKAQNGTQLDYQSIGSGGGISQIRAKKSDFSVTSSPLSQSVLGAVSLFEWPIGAAGVVPVANIPGVGPTQLRLNGKTLADIYSGNIKNWNDGAIRALNPSTALPNVPILPIHRSDGSGETFAFTTYLSEESSDWRSHFGAATVVSWMANQQGAKGTQGVVNFVRATPGAIGYVSYSPTNTAGLASIILRNQFGAYIAPSDTSVSRCLEKVVFAGEVSSHTGHGNDAWAICEIVYVIMHTQPDDKARSDATLRFFGWVMRNGTLTAQQFGFVLPSSDAADRVRRTLTDNIVGASPALLVK
jgi:phosphate transport system substrate-binding protein